VRADWKATKQPGGNYVFDKASPVFSDAVTLTKLSLLDCDGLNELARQRGLVSSKQYVDGSPLYPREGRCNVLLSWLRSIDGNHQWLAVPPPYARSDDKHARAKVRFSYSQADGAQNGLRVWIDLKARNLMFRSLFVGPLAAALEAPYELSPPLCPILPKSYPYRTCKKDPFPNTGERSHCVTREAPQCVARK
jgi:hypothetical protein